MSKQKDEAIYRKGWDDGFAKGATAARFQLETENARLRSCLSDDEENARLIMGENAKLRELVREMMRFFEDGDWCTTCESAKECEAQEQYGGDCLMRGAFHDRMRELGVEA